VGLDVVKEEKLYSSQEVTLRQGQQCQRYPTHQNRYGG
jgi:hypothetical protein